MRRFIAILFALTIANFSAAVEYLDPTDLVKSKSEFQMAWGEYAGQAMWAYAIDDEVQFHVVEALTGLVDDIIETASTSDLFIEYVDTEVKWFCEKSLVDDNLFIAID